MSKIFRFKQFSVDQSNCGMKVNTDAALLGSIADNCLCTAKNFFTAEDAEPIAIGYNAEDAELHSAVKHILEIGTGTGVIALMLAQRYPKAFIDAVEIDEMASLTAELNFRNSPFSDQIRLVTSSFEEHFQNVHKKYDLIVSNPPYFINSLRSDDPAKGLARHTDVDFFKNLISGSSLHLSSEGLVYLILPLDTAELVKSLLRQNGNLAVTKTILIHSFPDSKPYRCILVLGLGDRSAETQKFVIYESQNVYTDEYRSLLKDYLTIF